jgi:hypothetical protein
MNTLSEEQEKRFDELIEAMRQKLLQSPSVFDLSEIKSFLADELARERANILEEVKEKGSGAALLYGMKIKESSIIPQGEIWIPKSLISKAAEKNQGE